MTDPSLPVPIMPSLPSGKGLALALGSGGARGLAHIVALEALDELGVKPVMISGSSMGAIIGAAYAAGIPARVLRSFAAATFRNRARTISKLIEARVGRITDLWQKGLGNPVLLDGEKLLDLFWPEAVPDRFEQLAIPFAAVATDFHLRREVWLRAGALTPAVAGSMAIPGLLKPVILENQALIDGGASNPLPYDRLMETGLTVLAVDVGGAAFIGDKRAPEPIEAMVGASQILMNTVVQRMVERHPPHLLIRPAVDPFGGLEFFRAAEIFAAAEPMKDEIKRGLALIL
jgi:NTE family protein